MYTNKRIAVIVEKSVYEILEVGAPSELSDADAVAYAILMGKVAATNMGVSGDVVVAEDEELIKGDGYENGVFTKRPELRMTPEGRILAGYDEPPEGYVVDGGAMREMTNAERLDAGLMTQEEYDAKVYATALATAEYELASKLSSLMSEESLARAEIDATHASVRKASIAALLAVRDQEEWPISVKWPCNI